ncbi:sulfatase-like hydrolase/transferase [Prosthecobacter vanneervenii]|uniref:Arylsulfatase A-like enzyme n=1 Tax=Prosthecobacter vanneervenii TaxID=48466 RepID=A0A7W8DLT2_9BACT|nr:sulfatase-like hydrolase/transferase [Prosthecobacter vanneervenii]MBB5034653.1 arylsulfatase A-like enzyme [Prosthecobacter vanneervenii]
MHRLALLLVLCPLLLHAAPAKPNIVFIMADDLGWADVAFHGGNAPTPTLDKLAAEGLELTHHYSAPVCSPTRTGLMTGRCWSRFNVTTPQNERALPWDTTTLPRALKSVGYDTCLTGKWHLGSKPEWGPNHFGFDHSYGSLAGGVGPWDHHYKKGEHSETWHRDEKLLQESGHVTDLIASEACAWLAERKDAPFFLYVPLTAVHLPVKEPEEWLAKVPAGITGAVARHYAACIMHMDAAVGRIVQALEKNGQRGKTLLVFTSDNGGSTAENNGQAYPADDYPTGPLPGNNQPLRDEKGSVYEGGTRVPCLMNWPGVLKPGKHDSPVQIIDWMPTFCALAGFKSVTDLKWDGVNLWPQLAEGAPPPPRTLYTVGPGFKSRALRCDPWKLIVHGAAGKEKFELYNIGSDPSESKNLALDQPDALATMKERLADMAKTDRDAEVKE